MSDLSNVSGRECGIVGSMSAKSFWPRSSKLVPVKGGDSKAFRCGLAATRLPEDDRSCVRAMFEAV